MTAFFIGGHHVIMSSKAVTKEGGKRGVEMRDTSEMSARKFFVIKVQEPKDNFDLLVESLKAMNTQCDRDADEQTGGSQELAKVIVSFGPAGVVVLAYVPEKLLSECQPKDLMKDVSMAFPKNGYTELLSTDNVVGGKFSDAGEALVGCIIQKSLEYLVSKQLIPELESDGDETPPDIWD